MSKMVSKKLNMFIFIYLISLKDENFAKRNQMLNSVRAYINSISLFSKSEIIVKPRSINVNDDDFYVSFSTKEYFSMGYACENEKIPNLNNVLKEIIALFKGQQLLTEIESVRIQSSAEYYLPETSDFFSRIIKAEKIGSICSEYGTLSPQIIEFLCTPKDKKNGDFEITLKLDEEDKNRQILRIGLTKTNFDAPFDESIETLHKFDEISEKMIKSLWG
jgi:hypothetical protein